MLPSTMEGAAVNACRCLAGYVCKYKLDGKNVTRSRAIYGSMNLLVLVCELLVLVCQLFNSVAPSYCHCSC